MQKQFEQLKKEEIVFCCAGCDSPIIRDSRGHDHCNTKDGVSWFCENCDCPSEDNEDEATLCSTKYHKFVIIAMYNHEDEDKEFKTLGEAKAYCDNFLNYHYNDIQRLHRDDINDGEWSYENDWFDEEWQQKEGEENE